MGSESTDPTSSHDLATALESGQFFLVYQPPLILKPTGSRGRSAHPVAPPEPRCPEPGRVHRRVGGEREIVPVGRWALETASSTERPGTTRDTVSMSRSTSRRASLPTSIFMTMWRTPSRSAGLTRLSLCWSSLRERSRPMAIRRVSDSIGYVNLGRFAVDDFEPGESALDELQDFAIDIVKLDREFIATLSTSEEAASLVHRLMQLSESVICK